MRGKMNWSSNEVKLIGSQPEIDIGQAFYSRLYGPEKL